MASTIVRFHIVQGGIENGDKRWLEKAAKSGSNSPSWIAPKSADVRDKVAIYVGGIGLFATAMIASQPQPRTDWKNRYSAGLTSIKLIEPAISIAAIQKYVPKLKWADYPRSITSVSPTIAAQLQSLIDRRRKRGMRDVEETFVELASIQELRAIALARSSPFATKRERMVRYRVRSRAIHRYVLGRAGGYCESCQEEAPFLRADGSPYLEPHHTTRLADDGPDDPAHVIGLCPNCHRRTHHAQDSERFNASLRKILAKIEAHKTN